MDKITLSDKFKQLKVKINCSKSKDIKQPTSYIKSVHHINRDEQSSRSVIRKSPRIHQASKGYGFFKNLNGSERFGPPENKKTSKNLTIVNENGSEKFHLSGYQKNATKNTTIDKVASFRNHRNIGVNNSQTNINKTLVDKPQRDSSGFLKPLPPPPKKILHTDFVNEEYKTFTVLLQRLADPSLFMEVEIAYHAQKMSNNFKKTALKLMRKNNSYKNLPQSASWGDRLQSWLQFSQTSTDPGKSLTQSSHRKESTINSDERTNIYILNDWSVIKGSNETELMLSGTLIDSWSRQILEKNHKSSCILERTGNNVVKTICCTYQLNGNFIDGEKKIPPQIKKYFTEGTFPENWKSIVSRWFALNSAPNVTDGEQRKNGFKRSLEDTHTTNNNSTFKAKKMKFGLEMGRHTHTVYKEVSSRSALISDRSLLNTSVQTRAAFRRYKQL